MKQTIQSSAVLLALALPLAVQATPGGAPPKNQAGKGGAQKGTNNVKGGNTQQTTYEFKNDKFGSGDVLNFNTQNYANGGGTGAKSGRKARRHIFARDADGSSSHSESSFTMGGNGVHIKISNNDGQGGFTIENLSEQSGGDVTVGKDGANNGKDGADGGSIFARWAMPEAFQDGGSAKGGDSKTKGGNHASNSNSLNGAKTGKGGSVNMQAASKQSGGNTMGGNGGINEGYGGGGGSNSLSIPFIPFRKRDLYDDDLLMDLVARFAEAEAEPVQNGGNAKGGDSKTKGGNSAVNSNKLNGAKTGPGGSINMQAQSQQSGGNTYGGSGGANYGSGGNGGMNSFGLFRREAFQDGGSAKGGDSKTHGGNQAHNSNSLNGASTGKGGSVNMQAASKQSGGNTMGGDGGMNMGSGGSGGGFHFGLFRRALLEGDDELATALYARYAEPEAFQNGGSAKGGDSHTSGGNTAHNSNSASNVKAGAGGSVNMQAASKQKGGNTMGGFGGDNYGSGGNGGGFSFGLFRRENEDFGLDARDLDDLVELVARYAEAEAEAEAEAYAEPEADAEAEFEWESFAEYY